MGLSSRLSMRMVYAAAGGDGPCPAVTPVAIIATAEPSAAAFRNPRRLRAVSVRVSSLGITFSSQALEDRLDLHGCLSSDCDLAH